MVVKVMQLFRSDQQGLLRPEGWRHNTLRNSRRLIKIAGNIKLDQSVLVINNDRIWSHNERPLGIKRHFADHEIGGFEVFLEQLFLLLFFLLKF
jgi:hypothetical protein